MLCHRAMCVVVLIVSCLVGCAGFTREDGGPTSLRSGQSVADAVARIRADFVALHHPIVTGYHYRAPHEVGNFVEGYHEKAGEWVIELSWGARWFIRSHTRSEIAAALFPLVSDDAYVTDVAVVMDDLRYVGVRSRDEKNDSGLGSGLHAVGYGIRTSSAAPAATTSAEFKTNLAWGVGIWLFSAGGKPGTVAGELARIRTEHRGLPRPLFLDEGVERAGPLTPTPATAAWIAKQNLRDLTTTLGPLAMYPQGRDAAGILIAAFHYDDLAADFRNSIDPGEVKRLREQWETPAPPSWPGREPSAESFGRGWQDGRPQGDRIRSALLPRLTSYLLKE